MSPLIHYVNLLQSQYETNSGNGQALFKITVYGLLSRFQSGGYFFAITIHIDYSIAWDNKAYSTIAKTHFRKLLVMNPKDLCL